MNNYYNKEINTIECINFLLDTPSLYNKKYKIILHQQIMYNDFAMDKLFLFLSYNKKFKLFLLLDSPDSDICRKMLKKASILNNGSCYYINSSFTI